MAITLQAVNFEGEMYFNLIAILTSLFALLAEGVSDTSISSADPCHDDGCTQQCFREGQGESLYDWHCSHSVFTFFYKDGLQLRRQLGPAAPTPVQITRRSYNGSQYDSLNILRPVMSNAGRYTCVGGLPNQRQVTKCLCVTVFNKTNEDLCTPPRIIHSLVPTLNYTVKEGDDLVIHVPTTGDCACAVRGFEPQRFHQWRHINGTSKKTWSFKSTLTVRSVEPCNGGRYEYLLKASNHSLVERLTFSVNVIADRSRSMQNVNYTDLYQNITMHCPDPVRPRTCTSPVTWWTLDDVITPTTGGLPFWSVRESVIATSVAHVFRNNIKSVFCAKDGKEHRFDLQASPPEAPSPPYLSGEYITLRNVNKRVVYVADVVVAGNLDGTVSFKMHFQHRILPLRPFFDPNRYLSPTVSCHLLMDWGLKKSLTYVVSIRARNNLGLMSPATQRQWNRHPDSGPVRRYTISVVFLSLATCPPSFSENGLVSADRFASLMYNMATRMIHSLCQCCELEAPNVNISPSKQLCPAYDANSTQLECRHRAMPGHRVNLKYTLISHRATLTNFMTPMYNLLYKSSRQKVLDLVPGWSWALRGFCVNGDFNYGRCYGEYQYKDFHTFLNFITGDCVVPKVLLAPVIRPTSPAVSSPATPPNSTSFASSATTGEHTSTFPNTLTQTTDTASKTNFYTTSVPGSVDTGGRSSALSILPTATTCGGLAFVCAAYLLPRCAFECSLDFL